MNACTHLEVTHLKPSDTPLTGYHYIVLYSVAAISMHTCMICSDLIFLGAGLMSYIVQFSADLQPSLELPID